MKTTTKFTLAALALSSALCAPAMAYNTAVENSLKKRPELSKFYDALVATGVAAELEDGRAYTVFAPTNEALDRVDYRTYPCFYSAQCKAQIADVLRNHIVKGKVQMVDVVKQQGDKSIRQKGSLTSIDQRGIAIGEATKGHYTADGVKILSEMDLLGGALYEIDGVIANETELALFKTPVTESYVVERRIISYSPSGRADSGTETVVETTTTTTRPAY